MKILLISLVVIFSVTLTLARAPASYDEEKRLIQTSETETKWLTQNQIESMIRNRENFMDITDHQSKPSPDQFIQSTFALPTTLRFPLIVNDAIARLSIHRMQTFIIQFSAYHNRYYTTQTGVASSDWLLLQIQNVIAESGYPGNVQALTATHPDWPQKSLIARIQGADPVLQAEVVILGAHLDSMNLNSPSTNAAPGADDNGSGSVLLLETLRVLLESGFIPKRTIEFQWYAAEEVGLRGSQGIAQLYYNQQVNVVSMTNYDVVGFGTRTLIAINTDNTNAELNEFLRLVVDGYLNYTWSNFRCGYTCSDHASWNSFGYRAAHPAEADFSPYMHSTRDTIETVNFEMVREFSKLAVGSTIEIAEPNA